MFVFGDELIDVGAVAFFAAFVLVTVGGSIFATAVASASDTYASKVLPRVEFLPDSGRSQWEQGSSRRQWVTGIVLAVLALLVALAQLIFDIA